MAVATFQNEVLGASIQTLDAVPTVTGTGVPVPQFTPGYRITGNNGSEFIYCKLVLGSTTNLTDGQVYTYDKDFTASLIATANSPRGQAVGVGRVVAPSTPAGTYYLWLQVSGGCPVQVAATTPLANTVMETTATAGQLGAPSSATVSSKSLPGIVITAANAGAAGTVEGILNWPVVDKTN